MSTPAGRRPDRATARYAWSWIATGLLVALAGVAIADRSEVADVGLRTLALYVVVVAAAELAQLRVPLERAVAGFTLIEVAIAAGLLLLPLPTVVVATALGSGLAQAVRRLDLTRGAFNAAMATVGTACAAAVVAVWPAAGPAVAGRPVAGALVGMLAYSLVNAAAMVGLVVRYAGPEAREPMRQQGPLTIGATLGTTAVGVVVAVLWTVEPVLVLLALIPAGAIHLAARGDRRTRELLAQVRADHERLTRVVDGASDGIVLLDADGAVQVWSRGMETLTGIADGETVGQPVSEILSDGVRAAEEPIQSPWPSDPDRAAPRQREVDATLVHRDGTRRAVREHHALLHDDRGRVIGDVVVVRDVTRQAELERLRSDFVSRISHELRTPLTPIRGFASVLLRRGDDLDPGQRRDALERILERADHLGRVVEDLLLVTRTDADELGELVEVVPIDLGDAVGRAIDAVRPRYPDTSIEVEGHDTLPATLADPGHLERILDALLDNACRYSPSGAPVTVSLEPGARTASVTIRDRGPGIPTDKREAVFEPFHRLEDPMTMRTSGVGLGLFLARRLAQAMGGCLELGRSDRDGTAIHLSLRLAGTSGDAPSSSPIGHAQTDAHGPGSDPRPRVQ